MDLGKTCQSWNKFRVWKKCGYFSPRTFLACIWFQVLIQSSEIMERSLVGWPEAGSSKSQSSAWSWAWASETIWVQTDPFLGDSSLNILSKHILGSAQPLLAALGSWVTLKRQPKFWDRVHITEVCGTDLLDEVHPHDRTVLPFKEHHHTPKPLNIYLLPNTQRHTYKP